MNRASSIGAVKSVSATPAHSAEFVIYSFKTDQYSKGSPVWEKQSSFISEKDAFEKAEELFASRDFTRVEIRRRSVNPSTQTWSDQSVHIMDTARPKIKNVVWMSCAAVTCILSAGFIALFQ